MTSPYLRDRVADLLEFHDRATPLPMRPVARAAQATLDQMPKGKPAPNLPPMFAAMCPIGNIEVFADDSVPVGFIDIDGTRITVERLRQAAANPPTDEDPAP